MEELKNKYAGRLNIVHILSDPKTWTTWEQWKGKRGRIDAASVEEFITEKEELKKLEETNREYLVQQYINNP